MSRTKDEKKPKRDDKFLSVVQENKSNLILPDPDTVISVVAFVSPSGKKYQIIKTDERDEYEDKQANKPRPPTYGEK